MLHRTSLAFFALSAACDADTPSPTEAAQSERAALIATLDQQLGDRSAWQLPAAPTDGDWSAFPQAPDNPLTDAKIALGKALFFEPGISGSDPRLPVTHTASCGSCHRPEASFSSGTVTGRGIAAGGEGALADRMVRSDVNVWDVDFSTVNERRLVNIAWTGEVGGWMGTFDTINGYGEFVQSGEELGGTELYILAALKTHDYYRESPEAPANSVILDEAYAPLLAAAWPELTPEARTTWKPVALALAAYVRSISTSQAPFQEMLRQDPEAAPEAVPMTTAALRGATLFFGKGRCSSCHTGPALASPTFHTLGTAMFEPGQEVPGYLPVGEEPLGESGWATVEQVLGEIDNRGRAHITGDPNDRGAFAVPSVYGAGNINVLRFGHGAAHDNLGDFIAHKVGGSDPTRNPTLDPELLDTLSPILFSSSEPLLSDAEIDDLVTFIEEGLEDPGLAARYSTGSPLSTGGYCTPNNDPLSRTETPGCEGARAD